MEMLLDVDETQILAPAGWGDDYQWLWRYDVATGTEERSARGQETSRDSL